MRKVFIMTRLYLLLFTLSIPISLYGQKEDSFIDTRDGQRYTTVTYDLTLDDGIISDIDEYETYATGKETIYAMNLADSLPSSITWMTQNLNYASPDSKCFDNSDEDCDSYGRLYTWTESKDVCPPGWHLPTDEEWYLLANLYGGVSSAGEHLKSTDFGGTNKSLFDIKKSFIFWSSDEMDSEHAWDWKVNFRWKKLQRWKGGKNAFNSVRCVKDY